MGAGSLTCPRLLGTFPLADPQLGRGVLFEPTFREPPLAGRFHLSLFPTSGFSGWMLSLRSTVCAVYLGR